MQVNIHMPNDAPPLLSPQPGSPSQATLEAKAYLRMPFFASSKSPTKRPRRPLSRHQPANGNAQLDPKPQPPSIAPPRRHRRSHVLWSHDGTDVCLPKGCCDAVVVIPAVVFIAPHQDFLEIMTVVVVVVRGGGGRGAAVACGVGWLSLFLSELCRQVQHTARFSLIQSPYVLKPEG